MDETPSLPLPVLRYGGLAGSVLLAIASAEVAQRLVAVPLWFAGTVLLAGGWLLLGRRLGEVRPRWLLVTGVLWAVPLLLSLPLESRDVYSYACQGALVSHGVDPYTHGVAALPCPWLHETPVIWRKTPSPYGPLWLSVAGAAASTGSLTAAIAVFRLVAVAGLGLAGWAGYRVAPALGVDPVRGAWLGLASPLVLVHAISGAHNDALLTGLLMAAVAVGVSGQGTLVRAGALGVLVGLAVAVKGSALVAVPFLVLLVARDRGWRSVVRAGLATAVGLVAAYGGLWALTGYGLGWVPALQNTSRLIVETTSVPTGVGLTFGRLFKVAGQPVIAQHSVGVVRVIGLVLLAAALVALWLRARRRFDARETVVTTGVAVLASVVLGPVAFPWYAIAPLALLGYGLVGERVRWWTGVATALAALLILPSGNGLAAMYKVPGGIVDFALVFAAIAAGVRYVRHRRHRTAPVPAG